MKHKNERLPKITPSLLSRMTDSRFEVITPEESERQLKEDQDLWKTVQTRIDARNNESGK